MVTSAAQQWKHNDRGPAADLTRKQIRRLLRLARSPLASRILVGAPLPAARPRAAA